MKCYRGKVNGSMSGGWEVLVSDKKITMEMVFSLCLGKLDLSSSTRGPLVSTSSLRKVRDTDENRTRI